ncbi:MAG: aminoglycoside phosphotransferase family protein [Chloroflexota bacterium]
MISESYRQFIVTMHGDEGREWLDRLPGLIERCVRRWGIEHAQPVNELSYNFVATGTRSDNTPVVVKIGIPTREFWTELDALRIFDGKGSVQLLDDWPEAGAMLLEWVVPGHTLTSVDDDETATRIAANVMRTLWRPEPAEHRFPTVQHWALGFDRLRKRFGGGTGPLPRQAVDQAEAIFADLLEDAAEPALLHGDLHHMNILRGEGGWVTIDPKGVIGEPAYETGALFRNPIPEVFSWTDLQSKTERRLAILSEELGFDRQRLRDWGIAQAVLSAWWDIEDTNNTSKQWLLIAEALSAARV